MPVSGLGRGESITRGTRLTREQTLERLLQQHSQCTGLWWGSGKTCGRGNVTKNLPFVGSEYGSRGLTLGGEICDMLYRCTVLQFERKLQCKQCIVLI